jgi:hypothetical protein
VFALSEMFYLSELLSLCISKFCIMMIRSIFRNGNHVLLSVGTIKEKEVMTIDYIIF